MGRKRNKYPREFKLEAVKQLESGQYKRSSGTGLAKLSILFRESYRRSSRPTLEGSRRKKSATCLRLAMRSSMARCVSSRRASMSVA